MATRLKGDILLIHSRFVCLLEIRAIGETSFFNGYFVLCSENEKAQINMKKSRIKFIRLVSLQ